MKTEKGSMPEISPLDNIRRIKSEINEVKERRKIQKAFVEIGRVAELKKDYDDAITKLEDMIKTGSPDVIALAEGWLNALETGMEDVIQNPAESAKFEPAVSSVYNTLKRISNYCYPLL